MASLLKGSSLGCHIMKGLSFILVLFLAPSCSDTQSKALANQTKAAQPIYGDTVSKLKAASSRKTISAREYGEAIISGMITPTDNEQTLACLDSLQSKNTESRNFAFQVYKAVVKKSDGALTEVICGYIKDYLYFYPKEFLNNYQKSDNEEQLLTQENIAFEFYALGKEYQKELNNYFAKIQSTCQKCTATENLFLEDIRTKVETKIHQISE